MNNKSYYGTTEISRITGISETTIKEIAKKVTEHIPSFGSKVSGAWRLNRMEISFVRHVTDFTSELSQESAFYEALEIFYNIDCKRINSCL